MRLRPVTAQSGFTYVETIVTAAIMVLVFGGVLMAFQAALELQHITRGKLSALSLANDRMEYLRSLPYDSVGVVDGFPSGSVPQVSQFVTNGLAITERVRVDYVDAPADGQGAADSNAITTDYKQVRVIYTWDINDRQYDVSLSSNIVPRSIESTSGGGNIAISVLDADSARLTGASVQVQGASTTAPYNVTNLSDTNGVATFSVPVGSGYSVAVSGVIGGRTYSTSQTYEPSVSNPNPTVLPFSVVPEVASALTFQIGALSDLTVIARTDWATDSVREAFGDTAAVVSGAGVAVRAGQLQLADGAGGYVSSGTAYLAAVAPGTITGWEVARVVPDMPPGTSFAVQFYTGTSSSYTLIPEADLPGNAAGFSERIIDLSSLPASAYPAIVPAITLTTADAAVTPALTELAVHWRTADAPAAGEALALVGSKIIGTAADELPIYKASSTVVTTSTGVVTLPDSEFDTYTVTPRGGSLVATACPANPFVHQAGVDATLLLELAPPASASVRVGVTDGSGRGIPDARVQLRRGGYDETLTANPCGQVFFSGGGLATATGYVMTIEAAGYESRIVDPVEVGRETVLTITLDTL